VNSAVSPWRKEETVSRPDPTERDGAIADNGDQLGVGDLGPDPPEGKRILDVEGRALARIPARRSGKGIAADLSP
jgi:hypothetical protein